MTLIKQLRLHGSGREEWRVANPETGTFCMYFTNTSVFPERLAREWLEDHKKRFPEHEFSRYEVIRVIVKNQQELLMSEAADEIERLNAEIEKLREKSA